jgi:hemerythrin-like domain-containing protein
MKNQQEFDIPLTEDLMREHGILNRVLLIYENIIDKIHHHTDFNLDTLQKAVDIIRLFIEGHHERLEEDYIFPLFEQHKIHLDLIKTLKEQHIKGREISSHLEKIIETQELTNKNRFLIQHYLTEFITMYRPHEAHEDTEIFPLVRTFMSEKEFEELGDLFEDFEHQLFGQHGFENMLKKLDAIEKELGIADLNQFTPQD